MKFYIFIKTHFPELFIQNTIGKPREYSLGGILALIIFSARNPSSSFRRIVKFLNSDKYLLEVLNFKKIPHFSVIFKTYKKYLQENISLYTFKIGHSLNSGIKEFYLDSSSLISSKHDSSAKWGISTRHDWYKGYKLHMLCSSCDIPISFSISTANIHDSKCNNLLRKIARDYPNSTVFADKGYDSDNLISYANSLGISLICPLNTRNTKKFKPSNLSKLRLRNYEILSSTKGKKIYKKRWEIERLFGNLKENYNIDNHRVRGLSRKFFDVSFKILLFVVEKAIALLIYFCNTLFKRYKKTIEKVENVEKNSDKQLNLLSSLGGTNNTARNLGVIIYILTIILGMTFTMFFYSMY